MASFKLGKIGGLNMANQDRVSAKLSVAGLTFGFLIAMPIAPVHAIPLSRGAWPIYTAVAEKMTPRPGWAEFCRNYDAKCDVQPSTLRKISVTPNVCNKTVDVDR
jgi:hypothetical protein